MWNKISGAIEGSDADLVRFYLDQEPDILFEQNYHNETLLHHAARSADAETISELLARGARADTADEFGWTPLHEACRSRNEGAVALFITTGIDVNLRTSRRETPLHIAARHNSHAIIARLIEAGARTDAENKDGDSPLHVAARKGHARAIEVLIAAGSNLRARNLIGMTALHMTAIAGHFGCAAILLNHKANPHQLDDNGKSFLEIADMFGKDLFAMHARALTGQLEEEADNSVSSEAHDRNNAGLETKPAMADFYNDLSQQTTSRLQKTCTMVVNDMISGHSSHSYHSATLETIENTLWFLVYPFLLFILWKGFAEGALPSPISINFGIGSLISSEFLQTLGNTLLVIVASSLLITSENDSMSTLHFLKDMRETVHFRVTHLLLLEVFYIGKLVVDAAFFSEFVVFWGWFLVLYVVSYLVWWVNTHTFASTASDAETEVYCTNS